MLSLTTKEEPKLVTRCGYEPNESIRAFDKALTQTGPISTGKAIHFAADVVCSGGFDAFIRSVWDFAITHIGLASPRIFVYLKKRIEEVQSILKRLPDEEAYKSEEFQVRIGEIVLVIRDAPSRTVVSWPRVGAETHAEGWIRAAAAAPETAVLRKVWRAEGDSSLLRTVGAELCKAITDGSIEKGLFWIKWLFEEDARLKKEVKGSSLSSYDRAPPGSKQKGGVAFFILALYAEIYKELAGKQLVRMHEEFQTLIDLWRSGDKHIQGGARKQILTILTQILCEVPKWKVPAAPALIKDPVAMSQMIRQVPKFFREVVAYDPPTAIAALAKAFHSRGKVDSKLVAKAQKGEAAVSKMDAFDKAMEDYFSRQ
jgi:hypothetical protein